MKFLLIFKVFVILLCFTFTFCMNEPKNVKTKGADSTANSATDPSLITNPAAVYGQLKVEGNKIKDKNGNPVQLRGMSLFWSQWMGPYYNRKVVSWLKNDFKATLIRAAMGIEPDGYLQNPEAEKAKIIAVADAAIAEGL